MSNFSHLHSHTQFSLLDGASNIKKLFAKAKGDGHNGLAITDHGNMYGVFQFVAEAWKDTKVVGKDDNGKDILEPVVKPIIGCEFYLVENRHQQQFTKGEKDKRYHQLLLAKNRKGYENLVKLCSLGYMEGMYGKYPRIDKELVLQYHEGLIATTCCLAAEVPRAILNKGEEEAEVLFKWWLDIFGDDYYVELQRHGIADQDKVNEVLLRFAKKYNVPVIATNDTHYVDQEDYNAHDILLCVNTGEKKSTPTNKDFSEDGGFQKGTRFAFANDQFFFKTENQMLEKFSDLPHALENTQLIVDKVETLKLKQEILLPNYEIPLNFVDQDEYLRHLTYEGAKRRYGEIDPEITERIDFELFTIKTMGFAGYFLIVQDFINKGKEIGVYIGPGRGSAAGSAVAYCIGITNIDPIKYNLLFERFLNPDRKSMPDIDTDFEDNGRQKVIDYVVQKYGERQVAHIVTYGTMAAKSSIKDVARVLDLPLAESNMLAKLVPEKPGVELNRLLLKPLDADDGPVKKYGLDIESVDKLKLLRQIMEGDDLRAEVIREAIKLEGSIRSTGIHAAGIIIAPKDLTEIIPVAKAKDVNLLITQYEGSVIEDAGVIKMDFLGLKTLTVLKDAVELIHSNHGIKIDLDEIPLTDKKTFALYQRGDTNGTFQFESGGMQKYLRDLKPDRFDDLVAMNALYRPGPIEYIPNFIDRKFGREKIEYDLPEMEEYLKDTYGITVYQEQVMLLSQKLAGFTKGDADVLRKAMGKKDKATLDRLKPKFVSQAKEKGHPEAALEKIWKDWEAFAAYAFNKSHSVCYAMVAYQTAYLKANYPAEFMAGVLTNNFSNADKISFFLSECRNMGVKVLGPDINESNMKFAVNKKGEIRFTLSALKGLGGAAAQAIIDERNANGPYNSIFDFVKRVNLRAVNKKSMETLAISGAFDSLGDIHRAQYVEALRDDGMNAIDIIIKFGNAFKLQKDNSANSLFGDMLDDDLIVEPTIPHVPVWDSLTMLSKEKSVIGIYLSGHPLDEYKYELQHFCNAEIRDIDESNLGVKILFGCIVKEVNKRITKDGKPFAIMKVEDEFSEIELSFFGDDYVKFAAFFEVNSLLRISGIYRPRFKDSTDYSFRVSEIDYLNTLMEKEGKFLEISLNGKRTNYNTVNHLLAITSKYKGKFALRISLDTDKDKAPIVLRSKSAKVNLNSNLIDELLKLDVIAYSIRDEDEKYRKITRKEEPETNEDVIEGDD
ncbi:MAG: DNA polymerase III subunit alpha [Chitinophagales bacterium]|nr:DNA polymerase III subunit alpha [Chitinophagales bacterium]